MKIKYLSLFIGLIFTVCVKSQDQPMYAADHIAQDLKKRAVAVIRKDDCTITFKARDKYTASYEKVITILNDNGDDHGDFRVFYKEGSDKIKDIKIQLFDDQGKFIRSVKSKDVEDFIAYDGMSMISDGRVKYYDTDMLDYPFTVQMSWKEESSTTLSLPIWMPLGSGKVSLESSTYKVMNETTIPLRISKRNFENYKISEHGDYSFELNNVVLGGSEKYTPSYIEIAPAVIIAPEEFEYEGYKGAYDDWQSYGKWMYDDLLADKADLKKEVILEDLKGVVNPSESKREIVRKLYDYVQENTRYILIGLDEGGLVPLSTNKVHDVKYGDCKALSFYMKALLDAYGIQANYVVVRAGADMPESIFPEYPHSYPANHIILNVPMEQDTIWLDCTSNDNPFNFLGDFTDDRIALQIDASGGKLVRTPTYDEDLNKQVLKADVRVDREGNVDVDLDIDEYGIRIDKGIYLMSLDKTEMDEYLKTSLLRSFDNIKVDGYKINLDEEAIKTSESYQYMADTYVEKAGGYMILPAAFHSLKIPILKKDSKRSHDIVFPRSQHRVSDVTYTIPEGYRWSLPEEKILESPYGSYTLRVAEEAPYKYVVHRDFTLNKGRYEPSQYGEIKTFFDKIRKLERTKFSMTNKS